MAHLAVNIAVIQDGKILLTKRDDFDTWILPSGGVEEVESLAQAGIRKTKEKTGLDVELTRLVGLYSRLGSWSPGYIVLFAAKPVGGAIQCQEGKTIAVDWFAFDKIPAPLALGHRRCIKDAIEGVSGALVLQEFKLPSLPKPLTRNERVDRFQKSGLSRQELYLQMIEGAELREIIEVVNV
jgi:ADP-ribose pyrophosphatase YjhB (NUDIX family)